MDAPGGVPEPKAPTLAHLRLCGIVTLETLICFAVPLLFLVTGSAFVLQYVVTNPVSAIGVVLPGSPQSMVVFGAAGCAGVARLLYLLWNRPEPDPWRSLTLAAIVGGASVIVTLLVKVRQGPGGLLAETLMAYLPLACALHLVFLNRVALFHRTGARTDGAGAN